MVTCRIPLKQPRPNSRRRSRGSSWDGRRWTGSALSRLTWPYGYGYIDVMKTMAAGKFKDVCLKTLDEVCRTKAPVIITKRGRPVAQLVPCPSPLMTRGLAGSVLKEVGDPFSTGESWDVDAS